MNAENSLITRLKHQMGSGDQFIALAFVLVPLVARAYAHILTPTETAAAMFPLLRGVASGAASGMFVGAVACASPIKRPLRFVLLALWIILVSLNAAHILVNHSHADLRFASLALKSDFIYGSVFALSNLVIIVIVAAVSLALAALLQRLFLSEIWLSNIRFSKIRPAALLAVSLALALISMLAPRDIRTPDWMQMSLLEANIHAQSQSADHILKQSVPQHLRDRFQGRDLSGEAVIAYPAYSKVPQNVLLLVLEGVSSGALESGKMPYLRGLAHDNISYPGFINPQRQTNRGLFSLLCGEHPNYLSIETKADYYVSFGAPRPCLPAMLEQEGYTTVFMQGADLGYMSKDYFAREAGFSQIYGNRDYMDPIRRNAWGVDDMSLFHYALTKAGELSTQGKSPWFITALTSGTHHPYNIPGMRMPSHEDALGYLDASLKRLMEGLRAKGLLEDTLVLITSDEASGMTGRVPAIPMIAVVPQVDDQIEPANYYSQSDLQLSLLDYLGMPTNDVAGRSIFRRYGTGRELLFGNIMKRRVYMLDTETGELMQCSTAFECVWTGSDGSVLEETGERNTIAGDLRAYLAFSDIHSGKLDTEELFLMQGETFRGDRVLLGDRKIVLDKGDTLEFDLKLTAAGPAGVWVDLNAREPVHKKVYNVKKGVPLEISLSYTSKRDGFIVYNSVNVLANTGVEFTVDRLAIRKKRSLSR